MIKNRAEKLYPGNPKRQIDYLIDVVKKVSKTNPKTRHAADIYGNAAYNILKENFGKEETDKLLQKAGVNLNN